MEDLFEVFKDNLIFEWDEEKEAVNFSKHGIHFKTAVKAFLDPNKRIRYDAEHTVEERYNVLGRVRRVLFIVIALKNGNRLRIISARLATARERKRYYDGEDEL